MSTTTGYVRCIYLAPEIHEVSHEYLRELGVVEQMINEIQFEHDLPSHMLQPG
jgi:hypothetical protein